MTIGTCLGIMSSTDKYYPPFLMHFDSSNIESLTLDSNNKVMQWSSIVGDYIIEQQNEADRPLYSSDGITFENTSFLTTSFDRILKPNLTIITAYKYFSGSGCLWSLDPDGQFNKFFPNLNNNMYLSKRNDSDWISRAPLPSNILQLTMIRYDLNNTVSLYNLANGNVSAPIVNVPTTPMLKFVGLTLCHRPTTDYLNCKIYELKIFTYPLSNQDLNNEIQYFNTKWVK